MLLRWCNASCRQARACSK